MAFHVCSLLFIGIALIKLFESYHKTISSIEKETKRELTPNEKIDQSKKEAELHEAEKLKSEKATERLEAEFNRTLAENKLINLKAGKPPDAELPNIALDIQKRIANVRNFSEAKQIIIKEKEKYSDRETHEYLDAILDVHRKKLLEE